ncbi:hypothetical protein F4859DRAFT_36099 [Xylaria cf. heliscus]|nr:hypothetical protein F4859DRAFT_36099 [Xylaria cf. heliscus]
MGQRGPKKFTGSRRKRCDLRVPPTKPIVRPLCRHTRKRKTEVMLWMLDSRVPVTKGNAFGVPHIISSSSNRRDRANLTEDERDALKKAFRENGVIYRLPTFKDAEAFWKINKTTVSDWWRCRSKYLSKDDYDRSHNLPVYETVPGYGICESAPRPQVLPETLATADAANTTDTDDDNPGSITERSAPDVIELSDDSDIESDNDMDEAPEPDTETQKTYGESSEGGQTFENEPDHLEIEGSGDDSSDEDADYEDVPEADMYGTT